MQLETSANIHRSPKAIFLFLDPEYALIDLTFISSFRSVAANLINRGLSKLAALFSDGLKCTQFSSPKPASPKVSCHISEVEDAIQAVYVTTVLSSRKE